ncbi:MAG: hypothetical protein ON057_000815 [Glomeribacter sp. 1016415]|nr:hypothetical protein [Glomeribacter sp. 1016415]
MLVLNIEKEKALGNNFYFLISRKGECFIPGLTAGLVAAILNFNNTGAAVARHKNLSSTEESLTIAGAVC